MRIIEVLGTDVDRGTNCKEGIQAPPSLRNFCIEAISRQSRCFAGGRRGLLHAVVSHSLADPDPYGALALIPEDQLILTLREYLAFLVPGQSNALVDEIRIFLNHKEVVGPILLVTLLFFSALAFTILENAMSVIFYHRVKSRRRHFLTSALMPYLFILFLGVGLLIVTILAGMLQVVGGQSITVLGHVRSLDQLSIFLLYLVGVTGEMLLLSAIYFIMPVGRLSVRHALLGGVTATILWEIMRRILVWYLATMSQIQVVYGSLTTAIAVLLSVELGALILLLGAQVIAEYERVGRQPF